MSAIEVAAWLGTEHGKTGTELDGHHEAQLMDAIGETEATTAVNHPWRLTVLQAYADAYRLAAGICFECGERGATEHAGTELLCKGCERLRELTETSRSVRYSGRPIMTMIAEALDATEHDPDDIDCGLADEEESNR